MKVTDVIFPKIINYYVSNNCIYKIKDAFLYKTKVYQDANDELVFISENNFEVFDALKLFKNKTEKITLGEQMKFEYEMDISMPNGHLFEFTLDSGRHVFCNLLSVNNLNNNDIKISFKIID